MVNGRRQPSSGGTSRMMREYQVRICEGLGVKFPGPTRQNHQCRLAARQKATGSGRCPCKRLPDRANLLRSEVGALSGQLTVPTHPERASMQRHRRTGGSMRTAINASWIVGHDKGRHVLIHDGTVVYEGNRIIHVGRRFEGQVDRTIDARGPAGRTRLHRYPRACRPPRFASAHQRYRPADVLRPAVSRDQRAEGGQEGCRRRALPQARRGRRRRRADAQFDLHGGGAAAQRRHHLRGVRQPAFGAGGTPGGGDAARHARLSRARLRLRPLGRRRKGQAQARPQRRAGPRRSRPRGRLDRAA